MNTPQAPSSQVGGLNLHFPQHRTRVGLVLFNEKFHAFQRNGAYMNYSYDIIPMSKNGQFFFSAGISAGFQSQRINQDDFKPEHPDDPNINSSLWNGSFLKIGTGFNFQYVKKRFALQTDGFVSNLLGNLGYTVLDTLRSNPSRPFGIKLNFDFLLGGGGDKLAVSDNANQSGSLISGNATVLSTGLQFRQYSSILPSQIETYVKIGRKIKNKYYPWLLVGGRTQVFKRESFKKWHVFTGLGLNFKNLGFAFYYENHLRLSVGGLGGTTELQASYRF
jgi:hypothetical protein